MWSRLRDLGPHQPALHNVIGDNCFASDANIPRKLLWWNWIKVRTAVGDASPTFFWNGWHNVSTQTWESCKNKCCTIQTFNQAFCWLLRNNSTTICRGTLIHHVPSRLGTIRPTDQEEAEVTKCRFHTPQDWNSLNKDGFHHSAGGLTSRINSAWRSLSGTI